MNRRAGMNRFHRSAIANKNAPSREFDVMKQYSELDGPRKMALMDCLANSRKNFYQTVTLFWPEAKDKDCKKLEGFLMASLAANDV